jgi:hydrogenase-4 component F
MITFLITAPVLAPALCAVLYGLLGWRTVWLGAGSAAVILACGVAVAVVVSRDGAYTAVGGVLRVDAVSAFMVILIGAAGLLITPASLLAQAFLAASALAVLAANLEVLTIALAAATIAIGFLLGSAPVAGAVGIALALLGLVLLNQPDHGVTRIAVALLIVGFGTLAGLAPFHAWLADVDQAPVAALVSGVQLPVAAYAILRVKALADAAIGPGLARVLLVVLALATLAVATSALLAEPDVQRMLGYSSMAALGLVTLGIAAGSRLAIAAVLLHLLGHGLVKSVLFLTPARGWLFGLGMLALLGFPPFSLFASGLGIVRAAFAGGTGVAMAIALILVLIVSATLVVRTTRPLLVPVPDGPGAATAPDRVPGVLCAGLAVCAVLGVTAWPLQHLLFQAADILTGVR